MTRKAASRRRGNYSGKGVLTREEVGRECAQGCIDDTPWFSIDLAIAAALAMQVSQKGRVTEMVEFCHDDVIDDDRRVWRFV